MISRLLLLALFVGACSSPSQPIDSDPDAPESPTEPVAPDLEDGPFADLEDYRRQRDAALADLEAAIGTPTASGARSCLVLPVGRKACGGPTAFRVYSTETAEVPVLLGLAKRVEVLDESATAQFELASNCMALLTPPAVLEDGICRLATDL